eukprot:TRINITY_DN24716_c0_g1_i1.p1 TRINITY_DN24716_c0_g1~~TRINITY_DN24716_c0_g1_i1.p1  ORF type:complete len:323 (+),score=152.39 TRINITY_DN24716_c0_g1_i1:72-971(+)
MEARFSGVGPGGDSGDWDAGQDAGAEYLAQLDQQRQQFEREGQFYKAHECLTRMRDYNLKQGKKAERAARAVNASEKQDVTEKQRLELLTFTKLWEERLEEYERQAREIIVHVKNRQNSEYKEQEDAIKIQLMNKRPRFCKQVLQLRAELERMVRQKKYLEAEDIKRRLKPLEHEEVKRFDEQLSVTFAKKTQLLKQQYRNEINALKQRMKLGREELLAQRKADFERLLQRHANVTKELDQKTRLHVARTRDFVQRQMQALVNAPTKTVMDLQLVPRATTAPAAAGAYLDQGHGQRGLH